MAGYSAFLTPQVPTDDDFEADESTLRLWPRSNTRKEEPSWDSQQHPSDDRHVESNIPQLPAAINNFLHLPSTSGAHSNFPHPPSGSPIHTDLPMAWAEPTMLCVSFEGEPVESTPNQAADSSLLFDLEGFGIPLDFLPNPFMFFGKLETVVTVKNPVPVILGAGQAGLEEWLPVNLTYERTPERNTVTVSIPTDGPPSYEPPGDKTFGEVVERVTEVLGPLLEAECIMLEAKVRRQPYNGSLIALGGRLPLLPLSLSIYTPLGADSIVSQYLQQSGLFIEQTASQGPKRRINPPESGGTGGVCVWTDSLTRSGWQRAPFNHSLEWMREGTGPRDAEDLVFSMHHLDHPMSVLDHPSAPAWKRFLYHIYSPPHEVIPLLHAMFSSEDEVKMIRNLRGNDAQDFVDAMHKTLELQDLSPRLKEKCVGVLCRICGRQALLPKSLRVPTCYNRSDTPLYHGGFADVWKVEYQGTPVAVKELRMYSTTDIAKVARMFCKEVVSWNALRHPNVLLLLGISMEEGRFAMVSEWMANGNINEFVKTHREANRFELLQDVTRGLMYIHDQGMIHGDLKGANILIGQDRQALLADFGLITLVTDPTYFTASTSTAVGGTTRWMSPELLHPEKFGLKHSRPTKESDCYALGMVIYEVLSGRAPFATLKVFIVPHKVLGGERPERPEGTLRAWFPDNLWKLLGLCWEGQARNRPNIEAVLRVLKSISGDWKPLPLQMDEGVEDESDWDDITVL